MARIPRLVVPQYPHHVTQRGNRRQQTFYSHQDYCYYIELVSHYAKQTKTEIWAYCLMPNHVHLVMVPSHEDGLRATLGEAHRKYTRSINLREGWRGHLWQERFHSFLMDEDHLIAAVKYIELNPVAAKICKDPEDWNWSSAKAHIRGTGDGLVKVKPMLDRISDWRAYLDANESEHRIEQIRKHSRTGRPLGSSAFIHSLEKLTGMELMPRRAGRKPLSS